MTVKKQHAPDLMSGGAIRDGKGRIIDQTYALKTEVLAGSTNVTEGTFDELPANPNEGDIHILTEPYIDEDYTEGLVNPKLERVKYHTGTEFIKGETAWNRISNTGNKVNEWDYRVKTHFIPSTGVVKIARIDMYSNITFRAIYNVPAPAKETASCTISFKSGSAVGVTDNKYAVANLCFYKDGITNYLCIKPNGLASITIDLYDVNVYRGGLTPIEPVALTTEQLANVTTFTELGQSKEIVIDPTDTDNVLTLGLRKETQDDNTAYLDFNANSGIEAIDLEKGYYHILNSTIFEQSVFYWNGKTCYRSGGNYTTPVEVDSIDNVLLELDYINPGTYYFNTTKPINNSFSVSSQRSITKNITNSYESVIPADTTIGFTITEDNIAFFKKNEGTYITDINGCFPDETGSVDLNSQFVTLFTPQRIEGEKKFPNQTYIEHLYFETGVITPNSPLLEKDFTGNLGLFRSKLNLSRSGDIQLGDTYAVTGEAVYNYVNNNVVTINGNQTITGTKNFEDLEVNNSIEFNSGLNTTPVGSITVNNNELQIKDAKLELTESGNIELGDNYAVTANDVLAFVDNRTNITTINSSGFNFNNSGNFPEINKTKTFMVFGNISVTNGPIATLKPNTLIQYYRTNTIDDVSYLMQVVTIADQTNNIIYARKLIFENNQWSAGTWQILSNSLNLTNADLFSILQTNSGNTYGSSGNSLYNTIFGGFNVLASSNSSAVFGSNNTVQGNNVFVAGKQNDNNHKNNTTIFGIGNVTKTVGATIVGTWSNTDATSYFTVGNGYDNNNRSNLLDIKTDGRIIIKYNDSNVVLQDMLGDIDDSNFVHKTGNETINGSKTFNNALNAHIINVYTNTQDEFINIRSTIDNITTKSQLILSSIHNNISTDFVTLSDSKIELFSGLGSSNKLILSNNSIQLQTNNIIGTLSILSNRFEATIPITATKTQQISATDVELTRGMDVYTFVNNALTDKADDNEVVHKAGYENITGEKVFNGMTSFKDVIYLYNQNKTASIAIKYLKDNNTDAIEIGINNTNVKGKSGLIESGNLYFVTGGTVYAALQTKANDSNVVHKTENESITGTKTFINTNVPIQIKRSSNAITDLSILIDSNTNASLRRYENSSVTQNILLKSDSIEFKNDLNTVNAYVSSNSDLNQDWNTNQIPTKNAVATKISAEISNATDIHCVHLTYSGSDSGYLDHTLTEHHRTTYIYVSSNNAPGIQIIAPYPQKGDIIIVDTGNLNTTNGNGCFTPVASINDSKYHYWPSSKSYLNTFKDVTDAITINTHAKLKWWYNGTDWELIENVTSCGV